MERDCLLAVMEHIGSLPEIQGVEVFVGSLHEAQQLEVSELEELNPSPEFGTESKQLSG